MPRGLTSARWSIRKLAGLVFQEAVCSCSPSSRNQPNNRDTTKQNDTCCHQENKIHDSVNRATLAGLVFGNLTKNRNAAETEHRNPNE